MSSSSPHRQAIRTATDTSFARRPDESLVEGIRRHVKREIDRALAMTAEGQKLSAASEVEAVHEVRKSFKNVRAALRLVRERLGDDAYRDQNGRFRDAARPLTRVRDAQVLVETWDKISKTLAATPELTRIRNALLANERDVTRRVLRAGHALANVHGFAACALAGVAQWNLGINGWGSVVGGLRRVYRTGRRALARALELPTDENLHELRKQAKYLWHVLQLLERSWIRHEPGLTHSAHELSSLLGDDHDLAVLRSTLAEDPLRYGGHHSLEALLPILDCQRERLEQRAFALARQLYKDSPAAFAQRLERYAAERSAPR